MMSIAPAAVDSVGDVLPTQSTLAGQVTEKLPPVPCTRRSTKFPGPYGALNAIVQLAVSVRSCFCAVSQLMVAVEPELPLLNSWKKVAV
jgi:hypothetical protein